MKDQLFASNRYPEPFVFDHEVAQVFDDMAQRSIPSYQAIQSLIIHMICSRLEEDSKIVDLGCATGTFLVNLACRFRSEKKNIQLIGLDPSPNMIYQAQKKAKEHGVENHISWICSDINHETVQDAQVVYLAYTMQFIPIDQRQHTLSLIFDAMTDNGLIILLEKIKPISAFFDLFQDQYESFKRDNHYAQEEIDRKKESLKYSLLPLSLEHNLSLLHKAGFVSVTQFHQWLCFAGWIGKKVKTLENDDLLRE